MRSTGVLARSGARRLKAVVRPPYRNALVIIGVAVVVVGLFCAAYAFIGRFLPPGATVDIIRTAAYFRDDQHAGPFVVQAVWLVGALAALLISVRLLGRRPGRPA